MREITERPRLDAQCDIRMNTIIVVLKCPSLTCSFPPQNVVHITPTYYYSYYYSYSVQTHHRTEKNRQHRERNENNVINERFFFFIIIIGVEGERIQIGNETDEQKHRRRRRVRRRKPTDHYTTKTPQRRREMEKMDRSAVQKLSRVHADNLRAL